MSLRGTKDPRNSRESQGITSKFKKATSVHSIVSFCHHIFTKNIISVAVGAII